MKMIKRKTFLVAGSLMVFHCAAPRTVTHSGRVTPEWKVQAGGNSSFNAPSAVLGALFDGLQNSVETIVAQDTTQVDETLKDNTNALVAFSLDPLSLSTDMYLRFGWPWGMDIGYKYAGGIHIFDFMVQLFGPDNNAWIRTDSHWYGALGAQYSGQDYTLPSFLGDLQELLSFEMKRKDVLVPFVVGKSLGPDEKYGAFGFGGAYQYSRITYGFEPTTIYEIIAGQYQSVAAVPQDLKTYSSCGVFANLKAGYKPLYAVFALSIFYQNYGEYLILAGETVSLSGWTFIPNVGFQVAF